jgi:hypothetical protein
LDTLLFATSFVRDEKSWNERYETWIKYYRKSPLGHHQCVLIDDGSLFLPNKIEVVTDLAKLNTKNREVKLFHFPNNLGRQSLVSYPGWWRSFLFSLVIAKKINAKKIIHIESDAFILSDRMFKLINEIKSGWHSAWLTTYQFPETGIQIICEDQFDAMEKFNNHPQKNIIMAENLLPFTTVHKDLIGDRYNEFKRNRSIFRSQKFDSIPIFNNAFFWTQIPKNADFATQVVQRQFKEINKNDRNKS